MRVVLLIGSLAVRLARIEFYHLVGLRPHRLGNLAERTAMPAHDAFLDQAAHNLLLHTGRLDPVRKLRNFEGPILTVGSEAGYRTDADGRLVNRDGSPVALIHQYDRHDELRRLVQRRLTPNPLKRFAKAFTNRWRSRLRRYLG